MLQRMKANREVRVEEDLRVCDVPQNGAQNTKRGLGFMPMSVENVKKLNFSGREGG